MCIRDRSSFAPAMTDVPITRSRACNKVNVADKSLELILIWLVPIWQVLVKLWMVIPVFDLMVPLNAGKYAEHG